MPNKTLSFHDYIAIAKERMRGKTQEQVANMFNVSVSLIGKLEKHNTQYQEIQKHLQTSIIDEAGRFIAQVEKPVEAVSKAIGQIESMRTEIQKPVEAVSKVIGQIESMRTEIQKPVEAVSKVIGQIESMGTEIRKPVEAVSKAIGQIESMRTEIQKPAADVKKFLDTQVKAITHMGTEIQKPVEAVSKVIGQIESMRTEIQKPAADVKKFLDTQAKAITHMGTEIQKPLEAVSKAIGQIESMRTEIQKPAADVKKFLDTQAKAITHMGTEIQKPVEAVSKVIGQIESMRTEIWKPVEAVSKAIGQIESMRTEIQKPAADVKKFLDTQAKAITHMGTEIQKPVEAVSKAIAQIESMGTESEIKAMANPSAFPAHLLNVPSQGFQGYQIQGINPERLPFDTKNPGEYYLLLEPITGLGYNEEQELWGHFFNNNETVKKWTKTGASLPALEYVPTTWELILSGKCGDIRASNTNLDYLDHYAPNLKTIVAEVNQATLRFIEERNSVRDRIHYINAAHFKKN